MDRHPSDWHSAPLRTRILSLLAIACIGAGSFATYTYSGKAAESKTLSHIARNADGDVLLAEARTLYLVDKDEHTSAISLEKLSLAGPVTSLAASGSLWLIGDGGSGKLFRCDLLRRRCNPAITGAQDVRIIRGVNGVVAVDGRIYVTDTERHRLLAFDEHGAQLAATRTAPVGLCFPNGIIALNNKLYIADTNNFRIARIDPANGFSSDTFLHLGAQAPVASANCRDASSHLGERGNPLLNVTLDASQTHRQFARPPARPRQVWPAALLHTSTNEWWIIQMDNAMRNGDVVIYDAGGRPKKRLALPANADPVGLIETPAGVLIVDGSAIKVHRVALSNYAIDTWRPASLRAALDQKAAWRAAQLRYKHLSIALLVFGVALALGAVIAELIRQRNEGWSAPGTTAFARRSPLPLPREIVWIDLEPKIVARQRRAVWVLATWCGLFASLMVWIYSRLDLSKPADRFTFAVQLFVGVLVLLSAMFAAIFVKRGAKARLGVSEREVLFDNGAGKIERSTFADIRVGTQSLLLGSRIVTLINRWRHPVFPREQIENYLLSRLPQDAFVKQPKVMLEALRRGNVWLWITLLIIAAQATLALSGWHPRSLGAHVTDYLMRVTR
jgi:hypothetical protein